MAVPIPTLEPSSARAGDTWRWVRDLPAYPAPTWVLTYTLYALSGVVRITATADGTQHRVALLPMVTGAYPPGRYDWTAHVSDGTDRHPVCAGSLQILPNLASATTHDGRSHARRMLDAIEATLEGRGSEGELDLVRSQLGDRTAEWEPGHLIKLRDRYAAAVLAEERALSGRPALVQVRFR
jgi:hypothetical protein